MILEDPQITTVNFSFYYSLACKTVEKGISDQESEEIINFEAVLISLLFFFLLFIFILRKETNPSNKNEKKKPN